MTLFFFSQLCCVLFFQDTVVGVEEGVGVITDSVVKVFTFASEAVDRCLKLTEGWGLTGLIKAIREVYPRAVISM